MSITGNIIDVQKIQLTDTFQTWFAKTNEIVDALNPVNIYDLDGGSGTYVTYGLSGTNYNGVKSVNVNAGYGVAVSSESGKPWTGVVGLDIGSISGAAYTLTGNSSLTSTAPVTSSEINVNDYFLVLDTSDTAQGASGTTKLLRARNMFPREVTVPELKIFGNLLLTGDLTVQGAGSNVVASTISTSNDIIYLAVTGVSAPQKTEAQIGSDGAGLIVGISGGSNKEFVWKYNGGSDKAYWSFNTNYGAKSASNSLVNSKFIARDFVTSGNTANTFIFEAAGSTSTRLWLTENTAASPYFGIVKDSASSNVNFNVYQGAGITSVAYIRAGATSQYTGVTANAFIQFANVDMLDGAHAVTGASAWTIPVSDALGELRPDRHNAGQIKRRFTQASHGLTTGEAVTVIPSTYPTAALRGTLTGAQANSALTEAIGIVDRVISANEVSVTMKGYVELSANRLKGIGTPATGAYYVLDWAVQGGLTTNINTPSGYVYQPLFLALGGSAGIVYGNEGETIFPNSTDEVYMRGMIPIGMIQPYAGSLAGLTMGLSGGSIPVSDVQYNQNYLPCDGRAISAIGASGFVDLYNLIGTSYPMRGTVISDPGVSRIVIRMDRGTANLSALSFGSGVVRAIRRSGPNSVHQEYSKTYSSFTADSSTVTIFGTGITTENLQLASGIVVDLLTPKDGQFFFLPDLRGKSPFGEYGPLGARGEEFNLGGTGGTSWAGSTGATATGIGGLFTNYIIRTRREADALILTGHNHDSRYLRKDVNDTAAVGTTLNLQNLNVAGVIGTNLGIGRVPVTDTATNTFPVTWEKSGNHATWMSGFNTTNGANSSVGYRLFNGLGAATFYAEGRGNNQRLVLSSDHGLSGILISASSMTGMEPFVIDAGATRLVNFRYGPTSGSFDIRNSEGLALVSTPSNTRWATFGYGATILQPLDFVLDARLASVQSSITLMKSIFVSGQLDPFSILDVSIPTTIRNSLTVTGAATFTNNSSFNGLIIGNQPAIFNSSMAANSISVTGTAILKGGLQVAGGMTVTGAATFRNEINASTAVNVSGALTVTGTSRFVGNSTFANGINVTNGITGTLLTASQPNVTAVGVLTALNVAGSMSVTGAAKFNDPVTFTDSVTFTGQVTVRNVLTVTGQANLKNGLVISDLATPNIGTRFTGDDLHVGGRIQVGGLTAWNGYAISSKALTSGNGGVIGFTDRPPNSAGYGYGILGYRSGSTAYSFYGDGTLYNDGSLINNGSILPQSWANGGAAPSYIFTSVPSASSMPISGSVAYIV